MMGDEIHDSAAPAPASREGLLTFRMAIEAARNERKIGPAHELRPPRIYVSGPMTGLPHLNVPAFMSAGLQLAGMGLMPINPATLDHSGHDQTWASFMRVDIKALMGCDGVALLPGWQLSKGAIVERDLAVTLGMDVRPLADWLLRPEDVFGSPMAGTHRPAPACTIGRACVGADSHCVRCDTSDGEGGDL
jgi:hypothetical protein